MSVLNINTEDTRGFKFTKSGKIHKTTLQNLLNQEDSEFGFVEIKLFGINHVYSLVDFSKVRNFNLSSLISDLYKNEYKNYLSESTRIVPFHMAKVFEDCPIQKDVNFKSNMINLDSINESEWISLYQLKRIFDGMNAYSSYENYMEINYFIGFGNEVYDSKCKFDFDKLDLHYKDEEYPFHRYNYILVYENDEFEFCNEIYNDEFKGVFIYIPNFKCWQYLSIKKYKTLKSFNRIEIKYATTDSPRCFSNVGYHQEFIFDQFMNLIIGGVYIPLDIYFSKIFEDNIIFDECDKRYDALEIIIVGKEYQTTVLLTHEELGIDQNDRVRYMDNFCLLKLINKIILLKPY